VDGGYKDLPVGNRVPIGGSRFEIMLPAPAAMNQFFLTVALQP